MGTVHLELSADLQTIIDRKVAEGRVAKTESFVTEAIERFAEELALEREIAEVAHEGIADMDAGRFVTIEGRHDAERWMTARLANGRSPSAES